MRLVRTIKTSNKSRAWHVLGQNSFFVVDGDSSSGCAPGWEEWLSDLVLKS